MRQPTTDNRPLLPFLAHFGVSLGGRLSDATRYDKRRMLLMAGDVPAVLAGASLEGDRTSLTRVRNETTDDS